MKKKLKKFALSAGIAAVGALSLASCGESDAEKQARQEQERLDAEKMEQVRTARQDSALNAQKIQKRTQYLEKDSTELKKLQESLSVAENKAAPKLLSIIKSMAYEHDKQSVTEVRKAMDQAIKKYKLTDAEIERLGLYYDEPIESADSRGIFWFTLSDTTKLKEEYGAERTKILIAASKEVWKAYNLWKPEISMYYIPNQWAPQGPEHVLYYSRKTTTVDKSLEGVISKADDLLIKEIDGIEYYYRAGIYPFPGQDDGLVAADAGVDFDYSVPWQKKYESDIKSLTKEILQLQTAIEKKRAEISAKEAEFDRMHAAPTAPIDIFNTR